MLAGDPENLLMRKQRRLQEKDKNSLKMENLFK